MARAKSVSLAKFTASVQAAVKAATQKQPKFAMAAPGAITSAYLIRGIPVPDSILAKLSFVEIQNVANHIAGQLSVAQPQAFAAAGKAAAKGAILSVGGHVVIGIPAVGAVSLTK